MFKECLKYDIVPFIIEDNLKLSSDADFKTRTEKLVRTK